MKTLSVLVLLATVHTQAFGQDVAPVRPADAPAATEPTKPAAPPRDEAAVKKALELLVESAKAYREVKHLTDKVKITVKAGGDEQSQDMKLAMSEGSKVLVSFSGMSIIAIEDKVFFVPDSVEKYMQADIQENLRKTMENLVGNASILPPQVNLRVLESPTADEIIAVLTTGALANAEVAGHKMIKTDKGVELHEIALTSDTGDGSIHIDPKTKFIHMVSLNIRSPESGDQDVFKVTIAMAPQASDSPQTEIAFNPGSRKRVDSLEELEPTPVAVGEAAPDFTLETLEGEQVTLSKLQGSVVVLDFWATWCGPCKAALPKLQEFADWTKSSNSPVKVYAVNVLERFKDAATTKTKVGEFWKSKAFTFPTLLDLDSKAIGRYGFTSIPATVVVGPDGKIFRIHNGFDPNMLELLKKDVEEAAKAQS